MKTIEPDIMEIISDMEDFITQNWSAFNILRRKDIDNIYFKIK